MADGYYNHQPRDSINNRPREQPRGRGHRPRPGQQPYPTMHRGGTPNGYGRGYGGQQVSNFNESHFSGPAPSTGWSNQGLPGYYFPNQAPAGGNDYRQPAPAYSETPQSYPQSVPQGQQNYAMAATAQPANAELAEALKAVGVPGFKAGLHFDTDARGVMRYLLKELNEATAVKYRLEAKVAELTTKVAALGTQDVSMTPAPIGTSSAASETMTIGGVTYGPKAMFPIVIPEAPSEPIMGVTTWTKGDITERHNAFGGALGPQFYYSENNNAIYTCQSARRIAAADKVGQTAYPTFGRIYHEAPKGFPNTIGQWKGLLKLMADPAISVLMAWELYIIIMEFIRISRRVAVHLRDEVMVEAAATPFLYNPPNPERIIGDIYPVILWDEGVLVKKGGSLITGLTVPSNPFDLDAHARWLVTHQHPGGGDAAKGVIMNGQFKVDCSSLFAYALGRALVNGSKEERRGWMDQYAIVCSLPKRYAEYLSDNPIDGDPQSGASSITIFPICLAVGTGRNVNLDTVMETLRLNRIPSSWIDTGFGFGQNYAKLREDSMNIHWTNAAPDRAARLMEFGTPEIIPELKRWWCPSPADMERIRFVIYREIRSERHSNVLSDKQWAEIGTDPWGIDQADQLDVRELRTKALATIAPGRVVARRNSDPSGTNRRMDEDK